MRRLGRSFAFALAASFAISSSAFATDCAPDVLAAQTQARTQYVTGMSGLAQNAFSSRPGSFSALSCLDKFMQGNMDTFFKPPALSDLLSQALSFACQQVAQQVGGSGAAALGGMDLLGSMSGGLSIGGQTINLSTILTGSGSGNGSSGSATVLFGR